MPCTLRTQSLLKQDRNFKLTESSGLGCDCCKFLFLAAIRICSHAYPISENVKFA